MSDLRLERDEALFEWRVVDGDEVLASGLSYAGGVSFCRSLGYEVHERGVGGEGGGVLVVEDVKPHFNASLGEWVGSRADMAEKAKRAGLREAPRLSADEAQAALERHERERSDRIRHPERHGGQSLADFHYETFHGSGGERADVRAAIEASKKRDHEMHRRFERRRG